MMEGHSSNPFGFDKTMYSPRSSSRPSSIKRGIRPQSHTPISPPPLERRRSQKPPYHMGISVNQSSLVTSGSGTDNLGWDWPEKFQSRPDPDMKRTLFSNREGARGVFGLNEVPGNRLETKLGQKRPSAISSHRCQEPAPKRPKIESEATFPTMTRNFPSSFHNLSSSTSRPIKGEADVKPVITTAKKATGPFMVDSDSEDDSDKDEPTLATSSPKATPAVSVRHRPGGVDLRAQKEAQRLASERLRKEALDKKAGSLTLSTSAISRHHRRESAHGSRRDGKEVQVSMKSAQREPVTIDLCSDSEDTVDTIAVQEDEDDWLKGSELFGAELFEDHSSEEIVVAGGKKDGGNHSGKANESVEMDRLEHGKEKRKRLEERRSIMPAGPFGTKATDKHHVHGHAGVKRLGLLDSLASGRKVAELKTLNGQAHNRELNRKPISTNGTALLGRADENSLQRSDSSRPDVESVALTQTVVAKVEQERQGREEWQREERQKQKSEARLAREANGSKAAEQRKQDRLQQEAVQADKSRMDAERRDAETRRAHQQKLVEQYQAKQKQKNEQQARYEKSMALKKQETVKAQEQRDKDREVLAYFRAQEKKEEEAAKRAALAERNDVRLLEQARGQPVDQAARAREDRTRALEERNRRNRRAEDDVAFEVPESEPATVSPATTRGLFSLTSAAGVERLQTVQGLSALKPRSDGPVCLNSDAGVQKLSHDQRLPSWQADASRPVSPSSLAGQAATEKSTAGGVIPASVATSFDSGYGSTPQHLAPKELEGKPSISASLSKKPAERQVDDPKLRAQVGELRPEDIKVVVWRERGVTWPQVAGEHFRLTGDARSEDSLRRRNRCVTEALKLIAVDDSLLDQVENGDKAACKELNRAIHGTWPLPPTITTNSLIRDVKYETVLEDPEFRKKLGEVLPEDIKIYQWRESGGQWVDIASSYNDLTGLSKNYSTLKRRYEFVAEVLKAVNMSKEEMEQVAKGNMEVRERLNRTIHGRWPIHAAMHIDTSKPDFLKKLGEITGEDIAVIEMRDRGWTWDAVAEGYAKLTQQSRDHKTLRARYDLVTAALHDHPEIKPDLLKRLVGNKDESAKEEVNRAVHGVWPIPKPAVGSALPSRNGGKTKTAFLSLGGPSSKASHASRPEVGQKLTRDITEADCKILRWREQGMSFEEIAKTLDGKSKSLRTRYNNVKATLDNIIGVDKELISAVAAGDDEARQSLNFLVHGRQDDGNHENGPSSDRPESSPLAPRNDGRPSVGQKTVNPAILQMWMENWHQAVLEAEEPAAPERQDSPPQPDDCCHFVYIVQRRELKTGQLNEDGEDLTIDDIPWTMCGNFYENLSEANVAAAKQAFRANDPELMEAFASRRHAKQEEDLDDDGLASVAREVPAGRVEVRVHRSPRTFQEAIKPASKDGWLERRCWRIRERRTTVTTTAPAEDDEDGLFSENTKESVTIEREADDVSYTLPEIANRAAVEYWIELTWKSRSSNLAARHAEKEEVRRGLLEALEASGEDVHYAIEWEDGGALEIEVVEGRLKGPRNTWV